MVVAVVEVAAAAVVALVQASFCPDVFAYFLSRVLFVQFAHGVA